MQDNNVLAIILASGKGTRFGMPKAEAGFEGKSFLQMITDNLEKLGLNYFIARYSDTPDMLATLRKAVKEIRENGKSASGYLVYPVDFPFVRKETISTLLSVFWQSPEAIIRPVCDGHRGHPVIIPASLDLDCDDQGFGLKGIIRNSTLPLIDIPVPDTGTLRNINTQEDLWTPKS